MQKYFFNFASFAINPLSTTALYIIILNLFGENTLGDLIYKLAVYNSFAIFAKASSWQFVSVKLSRLKSELSKRVLVSKILISDLYFYSLCSLLFTVLVYLDVVELTIFELILIITAGYLVNNGLLLGGYRYDQEFYKIFKIQLISLVSKVCLIFFTYLYDPYYILSFILISDIVIWGYYSLSWIGVSATNLFNRSIYKNNIFSNHRANFYLSSVASIPISHLDKVILYYFLDSSEVVIYAIAQRGIVIFSILVEALNVIFIRLERLNLTNKFYKVKYFTFIAFLSQILVFLLIYIFFEYLDRLAFKSILIKNKNDIFLYYFLYVVCASFFWIHTIAAINLRPQHFLFSMIISIIFYYLTIFFAVPIYGVVGAFISLFVQYLSLILLRLWFVRWRSIAKNS